MIIRLSITTIKQDKFPNVSMIMMG